jgi:hypothetical protein
MCGTVTTCQPSSRANTSQVQSLQVREYRSNDVRTDVPGAQYRTRALKPVCRTMSDPTEDPYEPRLEGAGAWRLGRSRRANLNASPGGWLAGGLLFALELVVIVAVLATLGKLEEANLLKDVFDAIGSALLLVVATRIGHRIWMRRNTERQISEWESKQGP